MNTARTFTRYSYLGTTEEHTTCDCCGKSDLKNTVGIHDLETGEDVFFGVVCAARALNTQAVDVRRGAAAADKSKRAAEAAARRAEFEARQYAKMQAAMSQRGGGRTIYQTMVERTSAA